MLKEFETEIIRFTNDRVLNKTDWVIETEAGKAAKQKY